MKGGEIVWMKCVYICVRVCVYKKFVTVCVSTCLCISMNVYRYVNGDDANAADGVGVDIGITEYLRYDMFA